MVDGKANIYLTTYYYNVIYYNMTTVTKNCLWCQLPFEIDVYTDKRGNGKFCSLKCVGLHTANKNKPQPNYKCGYCDKPIYRNESITKKSKSRIFFCCMKHKALAQQFGGISYDRTVQKDYRLIMFRQTEKPVCNKCNYDIKDALEVHHKDTNHNNNSLDNLEILCCNCHALEHRKLGRS